jgi:phosphotransferase system enzyme I (PtsI)
MRKKHLLEKKQTFHKNGELLLKGRPVSRGVAIGQSICLHGTKRQFFKTKLEKNLEKELRRFRASVRLAKRQIKKISGSGGQQNHNDIFLTHLMFLEDQTLLTKIEKKISEEKVNAEWAVKTVTDEYIAQYKTIPDKHLRERYIDLKDISERILTALGGGKKPEFNLPANSIIIAKELKPSTLIELSESNPIGIITENGGWTSHTFILARELNLPAVTGLKGILRRVQSGEELVLDGFNGQVFIKPKTETIHRFKVEAGKKEKPIIPVPNSELNELKTLDNVPVTIRANLDFLSGIKDISAMGAKGIGLYRSEFLFNQNKGFPTEAVQIESYRKIGKIAGEQGVIIRTFDLSTDQFSNDSITKETNPALGLRGIRWGLKNEKEFRKQLKALLQSSYRTKIDIVVPMITDVAEILRVKQLIKQEKNKLRRKEIKFGDPKLGAMIEVPAAVISIDEILKEVDFINVGTNDLVQYLIAVDRDNEEVSDWFRTLHPAVIKCIEMIAKAVEKNKKPMILCGEMAGTPIYVAILIGLGITDFSMNLRSIPRVKNLITHIAFEEADNVVKELMKCPTADEMEDFVRLNFVKHWKHLFNDFNLPPKRKSFYR